MKKTKKMLVMLVTVMVCTTSMMFAGCNKKHKPNEDLNKEGKAMHMNALSFDLDTIGVREMRTGSDSFHAVGSEAHTGEHHKDEHKHKGKHKDEHKGKHKGEHKGKHKGDHEGKHKHGHFGKEGKDAVRVHGRTVIVKPSKHDVCGVALHISHMFEDLDDLQVFHQNITTQDGTLGSGAYNKTPIHNLKHRGHGDEKHQDKGWQINHKNPTAYLEFDANKGETRMVKVIIKYKNHVEDFYVVIDNTAC
jgi:hypothetical protein